MRRPGLDCATSCSTDHRVDTVKSIIQATLAAGVLAWSTCSPADAQISPEFRNDKISLVEGVPGDGGYWTTTSKASLDMSGNVSRKPIDPTRVHIRTRMKERRVLEEFGEFLSPLRLPRPLRLFA